MCVCGGGGGGGQLGYKKIWCDKLRAPLAQTHSGGRGVGGGGHATPYSIKVLKVIVALIFVSSHPVYTVRAQNI